jgi:hypothetical protein
LLLVVVAAQVCLEYDPDSSSGSPDHAAFFPCGAPKQFETWRQGNGTKNIQAGAAGRIVNDRAVDNRLSWTDDYLASAGYFSAWSNSRKSARVGHIKSFGRRYLTPS